MNNKKIIIITLVSALVIFWAYKSSRHAGSSPSAVASGTKLMPDLEKNIDNVGTVIIRSKGKSFKVHLEDGQWVMPSKFNYPVGIEKIRDLVQNSAKVTILEKKTASAEALADLGLDDPEKESSSAIRIVLLSADEKTTYADYIRGVNRKGVNGNNQRNEIYARLSSDNQAYLVHGDLNFDLGAHTLLSGETFAIPYDKFQSIEFNYPDNTLDNFTLSKGLPGELDFAISEPKDRVLKGFAKANAIGTSLEYMALEDIIPVDNFAIKEPELLITYKTFNGLTVDVKLFKNKDENWLTFAASASPKNEKSTEEALKINTLASKWVYKVDFKSTGGFYYKLEDLVKE